MCDVLRLSRGIQTKRHKYTITHTHTHSQHYTLEEEVEETRTLHVATFLTKITCATILLNRYAKIKSLLLALLKLIFSPLCLPHSLYLPILFLSSIYPFISSSLSTSNCMKAASMQLQLQLPVFPFLTRQTARLGTITQNKT